MVPAISFRQAKSSGRLTMMSFETGKSCNAVRISMAFSRFDPSTAITTNKSTSLSGPASPRACEPNRIACSGSKHSTIRLTICRIRVRVVGARFFMVLVPGWQSSRPLTSRGHPQLGRAAGE